MSLNPELPSNFSIACVSSSKLPPCDLVNKNLMLTGHICSIVTVDVNVSRGTVLRPSATARQLTSTTGAADVRVLGVSVESALAGSKVCMAIDGEFQVLVTGAAVAVGDFLSSSATVGVAEASVGAVGDFAIATSASTGVGVETVWARFKKAEVV